jgi:HEAT repeats
MKTIFSVTALVALLVSVSATAAAQGLLLPRDGWASWRVEPVDSAPNWCCLEWQGKSPRPATCDLDGREQGYSNRGRDDTTSDIRVYARFKAGKLERIRTLAASCPAKSNTPIATLDGVSAETGVTWLVSVVNEESGNTKSEKRLGSDAIAAIAVHRGAIARNALTTIARKNSNLETRKEALFWQTQVRGQEGAESVMPFMFDDPVASIREHAAFAIAQSQSPLATPSLIRQGNNDQSAKVRSQAWFWLSQTKAKEAEAAINHAIRKEVDAEVRRQAVFALSQLPAERATTALISIAEDKSIAREDRKQAMFWIGQSQSDSAIKYLDRILNAKSEN